MSEVATHPALSIAQGRAEFSRYMKFGKQVGGGGGSNGSSNISRREERKTGQALTKKHYKGKKAAQAQGEKSMRTVYWWCNRFIERRRLFGRLFLLRCRSLFACPYCVGKGILHR